MNLYCQIYRGDRIESQHRAHGIIVNQQGKEIFSFGNPNLITCIRSSFKPFQAYPTIALQGDTTFNLNDKDIAIMCASHNGETKHTDQVSSFLKKIDCQITDLQCGAHYPADAPTKLVMLKGNISPTPLHNNCSGKHAGMLTLAKLLQSDINNYTHITHIVQRTILRNLKQNMKIQPAHIAIDGCNAAAPFMRLTDIAKLYLELGTNPTYNKIYRSMANNPYLIGGAKRFDTAFITAMQGQGISKGGGEGVIGLFINTQQYGPIGMSLKIEDGHHRCRDSAVMTALDYLKILPSDIAMELSCFLNKPIFNHNNIQIGHIVSEISKL